MKIATANCPACGGIYNGRFTSRFITCEYCGTRYALARSELDELGFMDSDGDGYDDNDPEPMYEDNNSDPMYIFARDACAEFLESSNVDASSFKSTHKIVSGLDIKNNDDVYLIHDDTLLKSGKDGFAITYSGFYCRAMSEKTSHFISWEQFAKGDKPQLERSYIRQGAKNVCYLTSNDTEKGELLDLITKLWYHARKVM